MPKVVVGYRFVVHRLKRTVNRQPSTVNSNGFSLVEVVLSLFVVLALISILLTTSGSYNASRNSNLQSTAAKIANKQIENLRNTPFDSLTIGSSPVSDPDLAKLPQGGGTQTISSYQSSQEIDLITIEVNYTQNGVAKSLKMETLKYKNGL